MRKELDKLLDLQEQYVKQVLLCYNKGMISIGRAKELLGFDDINDLRSFIDSTVSIDKFKRKLWIEKRYGCTVIFGEDGELIKQETNK